MHRHRLSWPPVHRTGRRCYCPPPVRRPRSYSLRIPRRRCSLLACRLLDPDCRSRKAVCPPVPKCRRCPHCRRLNRCCLRPRRHFVHRLRHRHLNRGPCPASIRQPSRLCCRASAWPHHRRRYCPPSGNSKRHRRRHRRLNLHRLNLHRLNLRRQMNLRHWSRRRKSRHHRMSHHRQEQNCPNRVATLRPGPCSRPASRMPRRSRGLARVV